MRAMRAQFGAAVLDERSDTSRAALFEFSYTIGELPVRRAITPITSHCICMTFRVTNTRTNIGATVVGRSRQ